MPELATDPYALPDPFAGKRQRRKSKPTKQVKRLGRRGLLSALAGLVVLAVGFGVYSVLRPADISAYANQSISVAGLQELDFLVTPAELLQLETTTASASGSGGGQAGESKAGTVKAFGPRLVTFLQSQGRSIDEFKRIKVFCKDGYSVILRPELLEGDVILSLADDKEPLANYQRPMRLVIPGENTGKWAFGVLRIEFE